MCLQKSLKSHFACIIMLVKTSCLLYRQHNQALSWKELKFRSGMNGSFNRIFIIIIIVIIIIIIIIIIFNTYKFRLESDTKLNTILRQEEARQQSRNIFHQSDSSLNTLRADPKSESSGGNFWFSVVCVQRIELESIPMFRCEDILS